MATNRIVQLAAYPIGVPRESDFALVEQPIPEPGEGEVLVRNRYISVDPYMRARLVDPASNPMGMALGEPIGGTAVGRVEASKYPQLAAGDYVSSRAGWREYFTAPGEQLERIDQVAPPPLSAYLGVMGGTGFTAYIGMLDAGKPQAGETVYVSTAAGAVGSVAGQLAAIRGCRVVGSTGSDEKVKMLLDELKFDAAFNYRTVDLEQELGRLCPEGIDVYFDNVGGDHLQAALHHMKQFGRIVVCGAISQYNNESPSTGLRDLDLMFRRSLTMRGIRSPDSEALRPDFVRDMSKWLGTGQIVNLETVVEGIERAPSAFIGLFSGQNVGKMVVAV